MNETPSGFLGVLGRLMSSGALGVGLVLVLVPVLLLSVGVQLLDKVPMVGLPLLAIFGIMILFGSIALVTMLFKSLELTDPKQPLALPEGSIRAAIALSLIVLFAIISIMLFHSAPGAPFAVTGLDKAQQVELVQKASERVVAVTEACAAAVAQGAACAEADKRYTVMLLPGVPGPMVDMAKQLLILVGTLMTSVTSYYFAARSLTPASKGETDAGAKPGAQGGGKPDGAPSPAGADEAAERHVDGCDVEITDATPDTALPPARGGVAPKAGR